MREHPAQIPQRLGKFDGRDTPLLRTDVLVIGAGIAGGAAALRAAAEGASVLCVNKGRRAESNTSWAQGGVAAAVDHADSTSLHLADTLRVGAGLSDPEVSQRIIDRGPEVIRWLVDLGVRFDADPTGEFALGREGGHSASRVLHARGDATGSAIQESIDVALDKDPNIAVRYEVFVRDLLVHEGRCIGAVLQTPEGELAVEARSVVLAAGGAGQVYRETTNPAGACGDGIALATRAGARVCDMEFVQFHPTTLYIAGASRFLISEVVRGAGAVLRDRDGERFMVGAHGQAELAPRDVVSRAMLRRMVDTGDTHVYLDLGAVEGDPHQRFPSISRICRAFDIDIAKDWIPVRPGAHYFIGGVHSDADGRSSLPGLFVAGEVAATGFHGANRLASNSLLEGAVLGAAAGALAASAESAPSLPRSLPGGVEAVENRPRLQLEDMLYSLKSLMWRQVGLLRNAEGLGEAYHRIGLWHHYLMRAHPDSRKGAELSNMLTVSSLVAGAALERRESRGTHFRTDHPDRDDSGQCRRIYLQRSDDGAIQTTLGDPVPASDSE